MQANRLTLLLILVVHFSYNYAQENQTQDLVFDNLKFISFKNSDGTIDGAQLGRHGANAIRLKYLGNSFMFDALENNPVVIRNSSDETQIQLHPAGDTWIKSGYFGIGTTSPDEKLDIDDGNLRVDNTYGIIFENSTNEDDGTKIWRRSGEALSFSYTGNYLRFDALSDNPIVIKNSEQTDVIKFHPAGNSWFTSGNLGIGTTSPEEGFHLKEGKLLISDVDDAPTLLLKDDEDGDSFYMQHSRWNDNLT